MTCTRKGSPAGDQQPIQVMCSGLKGQESGHLQSGVGNHVFHMGTLESEGGHDE